MAVSLHKSWKREGIKVFEISERTVDDGTEMVVAKTVG